MKIIFDSEEEKEKFFINMKRLMPCPSHVGLIDSCELSTTCFECWKNTIPHEVKEPEEPIKDKNGNPACESCRYWAPSHVNPICQHCTINSYNQQHHDDEANYWTSKYAGPSKCTSCIYLHCGITRPDQGPCAVCTDGSMYNGGIIKDQKPSV